MDNEIERNEIRKILGISSEKFNLSIKILHHCLNYINLDVTQDPEKFKKLVNEENIVRLHICKDLNTQNVNKVIREANENITQQANYGLAAKQCQRM